MTGEDRLDGPPGIARHTVNGAVGRDVRKEVADDGSAATRAVGVGGVLLTVVLYRGRAPAQGYTRVRGQGEGAGTPLPPGGRGERTGPTRHPRAGVVAGRHPGASGRLRSLRGR